MKNCPFCKAEIEDNARFCLYCMKPLEEKQVIEASPRRRSIWIFLAIGLVLCLIIAAIVLLVVPGPNSSEQSENTPAATDAVAVDATTDEPSAPFEDVAPSIEQPDQTPAEDVPVTELTDVPPTESVPTFAQPDQTPTESVPPVTQKNPTPTESTQPENPTTEAIPCSHSYTLTNAQAATCTADGLNTYTCGKCGDRYQEAVPTAGHQYAPATCLIAKVCKQCSQVSGTPLGHSYHDGYCSRCNAPDGQNPKVIFEYREVGPNDYFGPDSYIPGSDLVITGVKNPTPDGVYEVPSYLDGKRVVGIMSLAFSGTDVRKVTLGENIIRVNQNAFSGCYNIESLYVKSDRLFLSRSAFVDAIHRNCTLTIYCSATCTVDDDLYGERNLKDIARTLGAVWEEWNG